MGLGWTDALDECVSALPGGLISVLVLQSPSTAATSMAYLLKGLCGVPSPDHTSAQHMVAW